MHPTSLSAIIKFPHVKIKRLTDKSVEIPMVYQAAMIINSKNIFFPLHTSFKISDQRILLQNIICSYYPFSRGTTIIHRTHIHVTLF